MRDVSPPVRMRNPEGNLAPITQLLDRAIDTCRRYRDAERFSDSTHRCPYGQPGLHVNDGSTISANLGVGPSLTITAQVETCELSVAQ